MMPITVSVTGVLNLQSAAFALLFMFLAPKSEAGGLGPLTISQFVVFYRKYPLKIQMN